MKKVIVAGTRDYTDFNHIERELMTYFKANKLHRADVEIVSGCARGVDSLGIQFAEKYGLKLTKFPANWNKYGKSAGYRRNVEMAKYGDILFAFWDGLSLGTGHMIKLAKDHGLEVHIVKILPKSITTADLADIDDADCMRCDYVTTANKAFCKECGENDMCHFRQTLY